MDGALSLPGGGGEGDLLKATRIGWGGEGQKVGNKMLVLNQEG